MEDDLTFSLSKCGDSLQEAPRDVQSFCSSSRNRKILIRDEGGRWTSLPSIELSPSITSVSDRSKKFSKWGRHGRSAPLGLNAGGELSRSVIAAALAGCVIVATTSGCGLRVRRPEATALAFSRETAHVKSPKTVQPAMLEESSSVRAAPKNKALSLIGVSVCETPSCDGKAGVESHLELPTPRLAITPEVRKEIEHFSQVDPEFIRGALPGRNIYYRRIARIFERHGVPLDLINLAIVESRFKPNARSNAGAVGIWQFMPHTASEFGLNMRKNDERQDPIRSSVAAARYLRSLFSRLGDWWLALAAYNSGLGRIQRLIDETGHSDFWRLARAGKLPEETARFVPRFIAITMILNDPEKYGVDSAESSVGVG
jgi:Transglycosylase SLT domain